jgi:hypothetical protein
MEGEEPEGEAPAGRRLVRAVAPGAGTRRRGPGRDGMRAGARKRSLTRDAGFTRRRGDARGGRGGGTGSVRSGFVVG